MSKLHKVVKAVLENGQIPGPVQASIADLSAAHRDALSSNGSLTDEGFKACYRSRTSASTTSRLLRHELSDVMFEHMISRRESRVGPLNSYLSSNCPTPEQWTQFVGLPLPDSIADSLLENSRLPAKHFTAVMQRASRDGLRTWLHRWRHHAEEDTLFFCLELLDRDGSTAPMDEAAEALLRFPDRISQYAASADLRGLRRAAYAVGVEDPDVQQQVVALATDDMSYDLRKDLKLLVSHPSTSAEVAQQLIDAGVRTQDVSDHLEGLPIAQLSDDAVDHVVSKVKTTRRYNTDWLNARLRRIAACRGMTAEQRLQAVSAAALEWGYITDFNERAFFRVMAGEPEPDRTEPAHGRVQSDGSWFGWCSPGDADIGAKVNLSQVGDYYVRESTAANLAALLRRELGNDAPMWIAALLIIEQDPDKPASALTEAAKATAQAA